MHNIKLRIFPRSCVNVVAPAGSKRDSYRANLSIHMESRWVAYVPGEVLVRPGKIGNP